MKGFTCLSAVLIVSMAGGLFSEELVFAAGMNSDAVVLLQTGENHTIAQPGGSDLPGLFNPLSRKNHNIYFYQAPATNPVTVPFSFLAEHDMCQLMASSSGGGSVSPSSVSVPLGGSQTFTATPDSGYEVDEWYLDSMVVQEGGTSYTVSNVQTDSSIYVRFKQSQLEITATAGPNGMITPASVIVIPGEDREFTAIPSIGYTVDTWYLDDNLAGIGGTTFMLTDIQDDHEIHVTFRKALAYSLDEIEFEDEEEVEERIFNNNMDAEDPDKALVMIGRVGFGPDPDNAVMGMRSQKNLDPESPNYGKLVNARAKGAFVKTDADKILVRFKYLFLTSRPGVEIVVYLSDSPELLAPDDPQRQEHYIECAHIVAPPFPRPGAAGTDKFAVFQKMVWAGHLSFTEGVYIELELIEPDTNGLFFASSAVRASSDGGGSSVFIDDWDPAVQCYGICMDINWDNFVDEGDFLMVIGGCGCGASGENACLDGAFSDDGYVDSYDAVSWDWALNSDVRLLNFCGVPLTSGASIGMMSIAAAGNKRSGVRLPHVNLAGGDLGDLLIDGKKSQMNAPSKLKDSLYVFDVDGQCSGSFEPASDRCNIRLIQGPDGENYELNSETGLLRLDGANTVIIPPGRTTLSNITEPRYNSSATVYIGIQDEGADSFGRPILDAAFDDEYVYVVPVVVEPDDREPYTAAAKLRLLDGANPPYEVVQLYDEPPLVNDNQYRDYLRELEIDGSGNLYVLNVHAINESDILWRYKPDGTFERVDLGSPDGDSYVPAPVGMYMSKTTDMLYMASAMNNPDDPESTVLYGFSTKDAMTLERSITINGLQNITGIAEDTQTGTLWIAGFNMYDIPLYPNPFQMAFYYPFLAKVSSDGETVELLQLYDPDSHDLALPMSVLWTGSTGRD